MPLAETIKDQLLTDTQVVRKVIAAGKNWIKQNGYEGKINFRYVRGIFHFDNCQNYMLSAKYILESATGLQFTHMTGSMSRLIKVS